MFKIGLENRDFCKSLHFYIVDAGNKKKKQKTKKNELHLLACSAALGPSGRGHRPSGDASSIYMTASYEELIKSWKKLEKVGTIEKKSFI